MIGWQRQEMAERAARFLAPGDYVNLGIGIPTMVADFVPADAGIVFQTENGMLGVGPAPQAGQEDRDLINAGKQAITELPFSSYFSSADSFAMIRGGHIDVAVLGAMEVSQAGDLANWSVPGQALKGVGGAMDLVVGVRKVIVVMDHVSKSGAPKLKTRCSLPLTAAGVVNVVVTNYGVFEIAGQGGVRLIDRAPGVSLDQLVSATEAEIVTR